MEWKSISEIIFDSNKDNKDKDYFFNTLSTHSNMFIIIEDENKNIFGLYSPKPLRKHIINKEYRNNREIKCPDNAEYNYQNVVFLV